jgi:Ser/Thr protein kinase RdoA (MazF antagonist)
MKRDEIINILTEYDLGTLRVAEPFDCDTARPWKITTAAGDFVMRECFLNNRAADLEFEHGLASWLKRHGFPVSEPVRTRDGRTWCRREGRLFAVYTLIPGERFSPGNAGQARSAGAGLAEFHETASLFPGARQKTPPPDYHSPDEHARLLTARRADRPEVTELVASFRELDEAVRSHPLDECLLFNDFRPENVLFAGEALGGAFDLDCCCWGPRLLDVAKSLAAFTLTVDAEPGTPARPVFSSSCGRSFLWGYLERHAIPPGELELLPTALRREVRTWALFDLREVEQSAGRWVQHEWDLSKTQIDMMDAESRSVVQDDGQ